MDHRLVPVMQTIWYRSELIVYVMQHNICWVPKIRHDKFGTNRSKSRKTFVEYINLKKMVERVF